MLVNPVRFPPGRARLSTSPAVIGSDTPIKTMGIDLVAFLAATTAFVVTPTSTSTLRPTSSAAKPGSRSKLPSACRYSMAMFCPSTWPSSRSPFRNASNLGSSAEEELAVRYPIRCIFFACCASARRNGARAKATSQTPRTVFLTILLFVYCCSLPDVQSLFLGLKVENKDCTTVATVLSRNTVWRIF